MMIKYLKKVPLHFLSIILILKKDKNYPQVFLEECKFKNEKYSYTQKRIHEKLIHKKCFFSANEYIKNNKSRVECCNPDM